MRLAPETVFTYLRPMLTRAKPDALARPKRFWKDVAVGSGNDVRLDGRAARTPGGRPLVLPTAALAALVAEEWAAQAEDVNFAAMPATRLAFTVIDHADAAQDGMADQVAAYAGSDLLCYFADEPRALVERETAAWEPLIGWAEAAFGVRFVRAAGIAHRAQPDETLAAFRQAARSLDDWRLTGLVFAAALYGSAVLAFAALRGRISGVEAFDLSRLDETFQNERWGVDAEAAERNAALREEAELVGRWFAALG